MGAEQSVENKDLPLAKENVQSVQSSSSGKMAGSHSTAGEKLDMTTNRKPDQIAVASHHGHTSPSPSRSYTTSTTPSATQNSFEECLYPFREKVKHLPTSVRKEKYEEEIYRLFRSPHPSHLERLAPVKVQIEKADLLDRKRNTVVTWNESQLTYDIGKGALIQRVVAFVGNWKKSFKRCNRSKADPWRRYGALRKLHEIGGIGCTPSSNQVSSHGPQKFYRIEAGSTPPPPPSIPPITTVEEYGALEELLAPKRKKSKTRKSENSHY
ncbi:unnamed protein product [Angiostrongylus costaricensis]|uniref:Uncharacterized protein n=1 Tax=Angiostrongylus costaricensis TaxID=334426 RepID=A0A0R3PVX6_ANGCS|nr:unnamed protein product [Angiostrongylus costaricensis]